tara:strand:- start:12171 stop:14981 length:2811 start_codon:yes stop_codon:yes gene_type:complete
MNQKELLKIVNLSCFTALDFETTGLDPISDRIIEIAAIRFEHGKISERFVTLVNPNQNIPVMITQITGISNEMVQGKPKENEIIDGLLSFLGDDPLVAHNVRFDQKFLESLCKRYGKDKLKSPLYDSLQLGRSLLFDQAVFNLSSLSEFYGLSTTGSHRAEKDTENCGFIFLYLLEELAGYPLEIISKVLSLIKHTEIPNKHLFVDLENELNRQGNLSRGLTKIKHDHGLKTNTFRFEGGRNLQEITVEDVFGAEGTLKNVHPNFETRYNQVQYALNAEKTLTGERSISVAEAGTGLGKTMAYLFGAFKRSSYVEEEGPTVVSCHTKHLQDQLFYKDLPQLAETMGISISAVMMKGRNNYICKTRFDWMIADPRTLDDEDIETLLPILFWLYWTKTGDISECSGFLNARRTWLKSSFFSESGFCTGEICNRYKGCYYGKLRKALYNADIIVINHSLLLMEASKPGFLPEFKAVIVDEAHNLIKSAYDQFKVEWSEKGTLFLLQNVDPSHPRSMRWNNILDAINEIRPGVNQLKDELQASVKNANKKLKNFTHVLNTYNENRFNPTKQYQEKPILGSIEKAYAPVNSELNDFKLELESIIMLLEKIKKIMMEIDLGRTDYPVMYSVLDRGLENITVIIDSLVRLTENQDSGWVYWLEGDYFYYGTNRQKLEISIHASMIDLSEILKIKFFKRLEHCLLTSATLKINDSFSYFLKRTGLDDWDNVSTKEFLSPFHYMEQVNYHQYGGGRILSDEPNTIAELVYFLHKKFEKRIMVLFTARKLLADTASCLRKNAGGRDLPLFAQIRGASKPGIIRGMYSTPNGILFGTNSFWEGVDLPGDLLEILILVKLPFDVPSDPLIRSYSDHINRNGGNSFLEYSIPECAIRFRQGFGRLIRTSYDAGRFICLDNRVVTKRYGEIFQNSIPVEMELFSEYDTIQ